MNNLFTVKFLQNLRNKKGGKGFTLIELLVVVIIIGVLAAVALPNLLGQVAKGRQAEAKNNLGAINRAQQAIRLETGQFQLLAALPIAVSGTNYTYANAPTVTPDGTQASQVAQAQAVYENDIKDYTAAVGQTTSGAFASIICEANAINGNTAPIPATAATVNTAPACGSGSTAIK